jgi:citrate lyase beta subunit
MAVTFLFVPGDRSERFSKALAAGPDAVILDLDDAVAPANKPAAREAVRSALADGISACVRINPIGTRAAEADLLMLQAHPPQMVLVPKATSAAAVERAREYLPDTPTIAIVESIHGVLALHEIARAEGLAGIALGGFDLCAELGARPTPETLAPYRAQVVLAARLGGVAAIDTPWVGIADLEGLAADARRAVDFGFDGKLAIHPNQVAPINAAFAPSDAELERARKIVAAAGEGGAVQLDGVMIDPPLVTAAQRVLARART